MTSVGRGGIGPCSALCVPGRKNCAAGCCACVDDSYTGAGTTAGDPGTPGPIIAEPAPTYKQNVLRGVTFPSMRVTGFENVMNGVTAPTLPSITGVSVDSLKKNVTVPTAPAATAPAASDSSLNWLWILIIIPIGIAGAAALSKSKST